MNFKIYVVGEKIEKFYTEAIKEYEKRLNLYCKIQLIHVKNTEQLLKKLTDRSYKILILPGKTQLSSEEIGSKINTLAVSGNSDVAIILGAKDIPHDEVLSISSFDMDLGLQTTIMFEQIYRGYRILNNQPYHK